MGIYEDVWKRAEGPCPGRRSSGTQLVLVRGPDARDFLQRICSQDLEALAAGEASWAAFLNNKGRLEARAGLANWGDGFWLDTPLESAEALVALLERYHFAEDLSIELPQGMTGIDVLGPGALELLGLAAFSCRALGPAGLLIGCERNGLRWGRCHGSEEVFASLPKLLELPEVSAELADCHRMLRAELRMGVDADAKTLAMEAHLEDHISTSKGCYTGQEIVARIHTYGHVNKKLTLVQIDSSEVCKTGSSLHEGEQGQAVGRVTSATLAPNMAACLALAYLPEDFSSPGTQLRLAAADGATVQVLGFPEAAPES